MWNETLTDDPATEKETRRGGLFPTDIDNKMYRDIQVPLGRLAAKASQLIGNQTTNLAECWMHIRSKFDGGKSSIGHKVGLGNIAVWEQGYSRILGENGEPTYGER